MKELISKRYVMAVCPAVLFLILTTGCFTMAVDTRGPLPDIIWPKPPDIPRIMFVNSISKPEDTGINESAIKSFIGFFAGRAETAMITPHGLEVDAEGRMYVVDSFLKKIHVYDMKGNKYYAFPENGAALVSPIDIAVDNRRGRIYVTDSAGGVVRIFTKEGAGPAGEIRSGEMGRPTGIAVNEVTDELLVVDTMNSSVLRFSLDNHRLKKIMGREGEEAGRFHSPTHIFVSRAGHIYVTDSLNFRVQVFTSGGVFMKTFGLAGDSPGYFSRPKGVAVDSDENIYVVDSLFDNVQVFDRDGHLLMSFGAPGHGYGEFWLPAGIFIDSKDMIYVSDSFNKRVQIFQYLKEGELP